MKKLILAACVAVSLFGCGKKKGKEGGGGGGPLDCAPVGTKMKECSAEFWAAYANTAMAKNNAPDAIQTLSAMETAKPGAFCEQMKGMFGGNPKWAGGVTACADKTACADWAACAAPVLSAAAK